MAKPDTDDGWLKYAHELDAALAVADFTKGARIVLREVFAQIFGPAKSRTARISPTEIAGCTGQVKTGVVRAVRELLESGVLKKSPDGSYAFNKDYESWLYQAGRGGRSGTPRLSRDEVVYCRHAPARAMAYKTGYPGQIQSEEGNPIVTPGNRIVTEPAGSGVTGLLPEGNRIVTVAVTGLLPDEASPPDPPNRNGRAELETLETLRQEQQQPGPATNGHGVTVTQIEFKPATSPITDPAEAVAIALQRHGEKFANLVRDNAAAISMAFDGRFEFYLAALDRAVTYARRKPIGDVHGFCVMVGRGYVYEGIPPAPLSIEPEEVAVDRPRLTPSQERDRQWAEASARAAEKIRNLDI